MLLQDFLHGQQHNALAAPAEKRIRLTPAPSDGARECLPVVACLALRGNSGRSATGATSVLVFAPEIFFAMRGA
jgi:hypothetical protein